jgi:hypothetical protein
MTNDDFCRAGVSSGTMVLLTEFRIPMPVRSVPSALTMCCAAAAPKEMRSRGPTGRCRVDNLAPPQSASNQSVQVPHMIPAQSCALESLRTAASLVVKVIHSRVAHARIMTEAEDRSLQVTVDEYRIGQLYFTAKMQAMEAEQADGAGVEVLKNEPSFHEQWGETPQRSWGIRMPFAPLA